MKMKMQEDGLVGKGARWWKSHVPRHCESFPVCNAPRILLNLDVVRQSGRVFGLLSVLQWPADEQIMVSSFSEKSGTNLPWKKWKAWLAQTGLEPGAPSSLRTTADCKFFEN